MAKKVLLKDLNNIELIPITRGELVLDSSGNLAFHSNEFLATDSLPGLTKINYVEVTTETIPSTYLKEIPIILLRSSTLKVYPVTTSDSVIVTSDTNPRTLTTVLHEIHTNIENSKITLDDRPTEGNTTHGVTSDGIFQELKETVGNIQILLLNV